MAGLWLSVSNFKRFLPILFLCSCAKNVEDKKNTIIAVEDRVVDLTVHSARPDAYNFKEESCWLGHANGDETRIFLAIPNILNLYRPDVVLSSIANIEIDIHVSAMNVNPDNIQLSFVGESFTPYTSWNSRFSLSKGYEWDTPGGDVLDLTPANPGVGKVGGTKDKILNFNITSQLIDAVTAGISIEGFLLRVLEDDTNSAQYLPVYTSNSSDAYAPVAILTFNNSEVVVP